MVFDVWSLLHAALLSAAGGYSPTVIPFAIFISCFFPQSWWALFAAHFNSWEVTCYILPALAITTYWINGIVLLWIDTFMRPNVLAEYKVQPTKRFELNLLCKVCMNVLSGQMFVILPYGYCCAWIGLHTPFALRTEAELPSSREMFLHTLAYILFNEVVFYYTHFAMHQKVLGVNLYGLIHKKHHEFTAPIGLVASYCHPLEMLISNAMPLTLASVLLSSHSWCIMVWVVFAVLGTQFHHSGYRWPWVLGMEEQPNFHDFHHENFEGNYGALGFLDRLHGTDKVWQKLRKTKSHTEHRMAKCTRWAAVTVFGSAVLSQWITG